MAHLLVGDRCLPRFVRGHLAFLDTPFACLQTHALGRDLPMNDGVAGPVKDKGVGRGMAADQEFAQPEEGADLQNILLHTGRIGGVQHPAGGHVDHGQTKHAHRRFGEVDAGHLAIADGAGGKGTGNHLLVGCGQGFAGHIEY